MTLFLSAVICDGDRAPVNSVEHQASDQCHKRRLFITSWNVGSAAPLKMDMEQWLPKNRDIYVIGMQECKKREAWLHCIADYLGASGDDKTVRMNYRRQNSEVGKLAMPTTVQNANQGADARGHQYTMLALNWMWEIVLVIFIRSDLVHLATAIHMDSEPTGVGDLFGNKGGVGITMQFEETSFCFVCCHLAARQERVEQRRDNYLKIMRNLKLAPKEVDLVNHFHHVIFFGDLNYRVEEEFSIVLDLIKQDDLKELFSFDQLAMEMNCKTAFVGFKEGELLFRPTYRMERFEHEYSNKRDQSPSWTDRILYQSLPGFDDDFQQLSYSSCEQALGSDHRPVVSEFEFQPRINVEACKSESSLDLLVEFLNMSFFPIDSFLPYTLLPSSTVRIMFSSSILENSLNSRPGLVHTTIEGNRWQWNSALLPILAPFIHNRTMLEASHIHLIVIESFENAASRTIGTATVSLRHLLSNIGEAERFAMLLTKDGALVGRLKAEAVGKEQTVFRAVVTEEDKSSEAQV